MAGKKKFDTLEAFAQGDPKRVMALMLWMNRHRVPDLYVKVTEADIIAFDEGVKFLNDNRGKNPPIVADVMVKRPGAIPASAGVPAMGARRAVPPREEIPARPYVVVALVEKGTENAIRPVENNQEDYDAAQDAAAVRKARDQSQDLCNRLMGQMRSGEFSSSDVQDAVQSLLTLAKAAG